MRLATFLKSSLLSATLLAGATYSAPTLSAETQSAYFAGGCFWCIEKDFEHVNGVSEVTSGYQGGSIDNPTYRNHPDYIEAVKIDYDPDVVNYAELLKIYFRSTDPTDGGGQFCDRGHAYTPAIFAQTPDEVALANQAKLEAGDQLDAPIATTIRSFSKFWDAEDYHQDYYKKNSVRYKYYRFRCGRNQTVEALWGDMAYYGVNH